MNTNQIKKILPTVLVGILVAILGISLFSPSDSAKNISKNAPDFTGISLDNKNLNLASYNGTPLVINFWASWCGPCREEAPLFRELAKKEDLKILGILFDEKNTENDKEFIEEFDLKYDNIVDIGLKISLDYGVSGLPETFFIDKDGIIKHKYKGGISREELNKGLEKIDINPI